MEYILLIIGFILIVKFSDILVDAACSVAHNLKIPKVVIALTIMAFGTCAPEIAISFKSISAGNGSMALSNVVGSCIINVLMIIGLAAIISPIKVKNDTINKEMPLLCLITLIFSILVLDSTLVKALPQTITRFDGIILLLLFMIFIFYLYNIIKENKNKSKTKPKYNMIKSIILVIISIFVVAKSSDLIVDNAVIIANNLNVSHKIITMVIIVIGTSLPELTMTVRSAKKHEFDIALGNIIGTNIFNICIVLGLPLTIYGDVPITDFGIIDFAILFTSVIVLYIFAKTDKKLNKTEGIVMFLIFICYYAYILLI